MTKPSESIPPPPARAADYFRAAAHAFDPKEVTQKRTFSATAREVRVLAERLAELLENPTTLTEVDAAAISLGQKCLDVQHQTLRARSAGAR